MGNFYMESTQINYRRDETLKTVDKKLQELSETSAIDTDIAPVFSKTATYNPGDMVYYKNKLYVFNVEHTGAWAAADVTATDVTTEVSSLRSGLTNVADDVKLNTNDLTTVSRTKNLLNANISEMKANNTDGVWDGNTYTESGVTFAVTVDENGYMTNVHVTGTATAQVSFSLTKTFSLVNGTAYKLSGCPSGGSLSAYRVTIYTSVMDTKSDYGSGADLTFAPGNNPNSYIRVYSGYELPVGGLDFKPMVRLATETSATFAPYIPSVESRIEAVENNVNGLRMMPITITDTVQTDSKLSDGVLLSDLTGGIITSSTQVKGLAMFNHRHVIVHWLCYQGKLIFAYDDTSEGGHSYTYKGVLFY